MFSSPLNKSLISRISGPNGCGNNNGGCMFICIPTPGNGSKCLAPFDKSRGMYQISRITNVTFKQISDALKLLMTDKHDLNKHQTYIKKNDRSVANQRR